MIMGVIAADGPYFKGVAYGVCRPLLSAAVFVIATSQVVEAVEWAITNLATVFNYSWGVDSDEIGDDGRYADFIVRNYYRTVVVAAGNDGPKLHPWFNCDDGNGTGIVQSPGLAWNVIPTTTVSLVYFYVREKLNGSFSESIALFQ